MVASIALIVGLGNPGEEYEQTRHNVGVWFVHQLAEQWGGHFRSQSKFKGDIAQTKIDEHDCQLLIPTTFMNHSGLSVKNVFQFYKLKPEQVVIVHDDLDLPAGTIRIKQGGGHGGHNGLRDIISQLGNRDFLRIRIGIGHPGDSNHVVNYVLKRPNKTEGQQIQQSIDEGLKVIPLIMAGELQKAMTTLHTN